MGFFDYFKPKPGVRVTLVLHPELAIKTEFANFKLVKNNFYLDPEKRYWEDFDNDLEYEHPYLITNLKLVKGKVTEIEFTKQYQELVYV